MSTFPLCSFGYLVSLSSGDGITSESIETSGDYPVWGANGLRGYSGEYNLSEDSVLIGRVGALCGNVHTATAPCFVSEHALIAKRERQINLKWLYYVASHCGFGDYAQGTAQPVIAAERIRRIKVPYPDLPTQRRIADYLDRETAQIDAMVGALDGLVARLEERKGTFVKSLLNDPDYDCVPTKLKHLATSENHLRIPLSSTERGSMQGTVPYYGASGVIDYVSEPIWTNTERLLVSEDGANLTARNHPIAFVALGDFWVNNHAHILATHPNVPPHLVAEIINLTDISNHISGSAQPKLTSASLWEISVPFPREHSRRLAMNQKIESETAKIDAMIAKAGELRALLNERRSALITATVTGQHPVPEEP